MEKIHEIDENSTYDEAFNSSIKMINMAYKLCLDRTLTSYDDFKQECAICFYFKLKNKYSPLDAFYITSKAYKWVALNLNKKKKFSLGKEKDVAEWQIEDRHSSTYFPRNDYGLKDVDFMICKLLICGYSLEEVAKQVGFTPKTTQLHLVKIRKKLADYYGIKDYFKTKRGHCWTTASKKRISGENSPLSKRVGAFKGDKLVEVFESGRLAVKKYGYGIYQSLYKGYHCRGYIWKYI